MDEGEEEKEQIHSGFLARGHNKLRFTELNETFFARLLLSKCSDVAATDQTTVKISLADLFRRYSDVQLRTLLSDVTISEAPKQTELLADVLAAIGLGPLDASKKHEPALDYYHNHIESRLQWLQSGDEKFGRQPAIDGFTVNEEGRLKFFDVLVRPATLRQRVADYVCADLDQLGNLLGMLERAPARPPGSGPVIDYRKQLQMLTDFLEERQNLTGAPSFSIFSNQAPFRWAFLEYPDQGLVLPLPGTTGVEDKIILPFFMEINGLLDIITLDLESDPLHPQDIVIRYVLRRPAVANLFGANQHGLLPQIRSQLNETELAVYHRQHRALQEGLVFGAKPKLEQSFGAACAWLIRKASYCLQEPAYLGQPARYWLDQHKSDNRILMEDQFFLPFLYERLREEFGSRVTKKPERFGGEIDILFDDTIPIELKVRRGKTRPLDVADVDEKYRPGGQASTYAAISRIGIVAVLDLPGEVSQPVSLENCVTVVERRFPADAAYPTCIVLIVFRCYGKSPSLVR